MSDFPELTPNAITVLERRYLAKDVEGNIIEDTDGMFWRVAHNLSQADLGYGATERDRQNTENEFYDMMRQLECLPNSPTLMNAGRELQQLSACFVLPVEDSIEGIFESVKQTAIIHKSGGGTGFSFSRLRPSGDVVGSTGGIASGPVSFMRAFDTATDVVKQGGTRRGANMGMLRVDHPDIMEFINMKSDGTQLQNFNVSVAITDEFMEAVRNEGVYRIIHPRTGECQRLESAGHVWRKVTEMAHKTGDPGLIFIDEINRHNPNPRLGAIEAVNPCAEQMLMPYESCNLASINLARMVDHVQNTVGGTDCIVDWQKLAKTIVTTVHMLDNVIDMNKYPLPEIEEMSKKTRRIGLGVMGWADMLIQLGIRYDSDEAIALAEDVMGFIKFETHKASQVLGKERGAYPAMENRWTGKPMRNTAPTTIAPTGTISIIAGCSSGIEPLFALAYTRNVMDGTKLTEFNPAFLDAFKRIQIMHPDEMVMEDVVAKGGIAHNLNFPEHWRNIFRTSHEIAPEWHVKMQAAFQKHTDNAVSKTINFPAEATVEDVSKAYMMAYDMGCKGITVYRDGSKDNQVLSTGETLKFLEEHQQEIEGEALGIMQDKFFESLVNHNIPDDAVTFDTVSVPIYYQPNPRFKPRQRPQAMRGVTERVNTGHGKVYVTMNFDDDGNPFEVFGNLGKAGGCDSAQLEAISRLISLALRSGVSPYEVIAQLQGITCCPLWVDGKQVLSTPDAVAHAMIRQVEQHGFDAELTLARDECNECDMIGAHNCSTHCGEYDNESGMMVDFDVPTASAQCPNCDSRAMAYAEGCATCHSCGWSKCD